MCALSQRSDVGLSAVDFTVTLAVNVSLGIEGYAIMSAPGGDAVIISGGDARGILFGCGKFLRTSRYDGVDSIGFASIVGCAPLVIICIFCRHYSIWLPRPTRLLIQRVCSCLKNTLLDQHIAAYG